MGAERTRKVIEPVRRLPLPFTPTSTYSIDGWLSPLGRPGIPRCSRVEQKIDLNRCTVDYHIGDQPTLREG